MPNWCYNSLTIEGNADDISAVKSQLNTPFTRQHENYNMQTKQMETKDYTFSNPIFSFWNIIKPDNLEEYAKQDDFSKPIEERLQFKGDNWYDWNVRNWGTKWDVAVGDEEQYPETELMEDGETVLAYRFNTAWGAPLQAIETLSSQYPEIEFELSFEEETGWGGEYIFVDGNSTEIESYESKCRDCDTTDCMEYCDNECGEICSACNYMGEADLDAVAECDTRKIYLDDEHVPAYRKAE